MKLGNERSIGAEGDSLYHIALQFELSDFAHTSAQLFQMTVLP
jgi:hypothetical protein